MWASTPSAEPEHIPTCRPHCEASCAARDLTADNCLLQLVRLMKMTGRLHFWSHPVLQNPHKLILKMYLYPDLFFTLQG